MSARGRGARAAWPLALAAFLGVAGCRDSGRDPEPPSLVLIVIDTLRADRLGTYGYHEPTSPRIDELAARGITFEHAVSPAPFTMPAMAALFTGLYPDRAGVVNHSSRDRLVTSLPTLAELASAAGYTTAAVVANPWLSNRSMGFDRGFDHFVTKRDPSGVEGRLDARRVTDRAIGLWSSIEAERLLLWVHYIDVHMPYRPPPEVAADFGIPSATTAVTEDFERGRRVRQRIYFEGDYAEAALSATRALYAAAVRYVDDEIGRLLDAVATSRRGRSTLVVVAADHGESLGEHGLFFAHDFTLHEELIRVPLVMAGPGISPGRHDEIVSLVDVLPTLCELMTLACDEGLDGISLPIGGSPTDDRGARTVFAASAPARARYDRSPFTFLDGPDGRWTMARRGDLKLIRVPHPEGARLLRFDLATDPDELHPIADDHRFDDLGDELDAWMERMRSGTPATSAEPGSFTTEEMRELRALGYLD